MTCRWLLRSSVLIVSMINKKKWFFSCKNFSSSVFILLSVTKIIFTEIQEKHFIWRTKKYQIFFLINVRKGARINLVTSQTKGWQTMFFIVSCFRLTGQLTFLVKLPTFPSTTHQAGRQILQDLDVVRSRMYLHLIPWNHCWTNEVLESLVDLSSEYCWRCLKTVFEKN